MTSRRAREEMKAANAAQAERRMAEVRQRLADNVAVKATKLGVIYKRADTPTCGDASGHRSRAGHLCARPVGHSSTDGLGHVCRCAAEQFLTVHALRSTTPGVAS